MATSVVAGIGWHMVGAASGASFYAPLGKVKRWSWETTWAIAGLFSWVILPIAVSAWVLPHFAEFYTSLNSGVVWSTVLFGCMWGIGNISYGLTMRYLGMSLGIGIAIGVTLVFGTLMPPMLHGQLLSLLETGSGLFNLCGIFLAVIGVGVVSYAGHRKERQLGEAIENVSLGKGILLAVACGIFSSGMSFAIDSAKPIELAAHGAGVSSGFAALPGYVLIMGGGAIVNFTYCLTLLARKQGAAVKADISQPPSVMARNGMLAAMGGTMWYLQYYFYSWGASNIAQNFSYLNWMLHMSGYVLFGGLVGVALGEWSQVNARTVRILWLGILIIIGAANCVGIAMMS
ncbi:MAG: L-rhamnose/proton symporter RhaT [Acidobacteriota bacterium]